MERIHPHLHRGLLPNLSNVLIYLGLDLDNDIFNALGMDSSVRYQPFECPPCDLTLDRIKTRDDDRFGSVIDNQIHARRHLHRSDVATFAPNDSSLHFVVGEIHDRKRALRHMVRRITLNGDSDDAIGFLFRVLPRFLLDSTNLTGAFMAGLLDHLIYEDLLGLCSRQTGNLFERPGLLLTKPVHFFQMRIELFVLLHGLFQLIFYLPFSFLDRFTFAFERFFPLDEPTFLRLELLPPFLDFFFQFPADAQPLLFGFQFRLATGVLRLSSGFGLDPRGLFFSFLKFGLDGYPAKQEPDDAACNQNQRHQAQACGIHPNGYPFRHSDSPPR